MLVNKTYPKHQALKVVKKQVAGGLGIRGICWNSHTGVNTIWKGLEREYSLRTTLGREDDWTQVQLIRIMKLIIQMGNLIGHGPSHYKRQGESQ